MHDNLKRFLRLSRAGGVPDKPKAHLIVHMIERASFSGNPNYGATFTDEGLNAIVKAIGQKAHRSVWEERVFAHFARSEGYRASSGQPKKRKC